MMNLKSNISYSDSFVPPPLVDNKVVWWFWVKWALALFVIFIIYLVTMIKVPILYGDLFMNIDLGRIVLQPNTDWAITWMTKQGEPVFLFNYIGIVIQEYTFQWFGLYGPIMMTLIGALVAATLLLKWLLIKGIPPHVSFILSLAFLLDPIFVQSYTVGRLDSWTLALCIGVCFLIGDSLNHLQVNKSFRNRLVLAGGIAAVSFFTWPSAVFLFPLIFWELLCLSKEYKVETKSWKKAAFPIMFFGLGGLIVCLLLILPIHNRLFVQLNEIVNTIKINLQVENINNEQPLYISYFSSSVEIFRILKFSPFLPLLAFISIIRLKKIGLSFAGLFTIALMIFTVVYIHRVLYLLPYFIVAIAYIFQVNHTNRNVVKPFLSLSQQAYVLTLIIIWSVSLSIGTRTVFMVERMNDNESELLYKAADSMVGSVNQGVLTPYEFYHIGRSMGWKMYAPYTHIGAEKLSVEELEPLLPLVDYAIIGLSSVTEDLANQLTEEGLYSRGNFYLYKNPLPPDNGKNTNIKRLRNLYHIFKQPYGPYQLFARETKKQQSSLLFY